MIWPTRPLAAAIVAAAILAIAPTAHAAVVTDSFTGTNGTLLENHTGETGATWTWHSNYAADLKIQDNRVWGPEWGLYFASGIPPTAEYDVSADLHVKSNAGAIGVVARSSTSGTDQLYMARYNNGTGSWELVKCSGGSCSVLSSYAQTLTVGTTYALKLEVRDAAKKLFVNGVERASSTDNAITQIGRVGIRSGPGTTTSSTGYHLDNLSVVAAPPETTITAGPSGTTSNASPSFSFSSNPSSGATFECKLDGPGSTTGSWGSCTSPKSYSSLANGSYTFSVRATVAGVVDPAPATRAFTVSVGTTQCSDGTDNDGDGQTDFGADPQCHSSADNNESPAPYTVNFDDSFEAATFPEVEALGAWESSPLEETAPSAYVDQVTPSGYSASNGSKVAEAHLGGFDERAELNCYASSGADRCAAPDSSDWYYEFDVRVPSGQTLPAGGGTDAPASILQTGPGGGCYRGSMRAYPSSDGDGNKFKLTSHHRKGTCSSSLFNDVNLGNFARDTWHHILLRVKWSSTSSVGFVEVEVNGVKSTVAGLGSSYPFATHPGGTANMPFRLGIYRTPPPSTSRPVTFQFDNLKLGPAT